MPLGIEIDRTDIDSIADALDVSFADEDRRNALLSTETCDIQACPGSGKTTLLVAKLAILSRKWSWRDQGICVLSHTNAARHEVEHRLGGYPSAHRLLGYPHFVGTIQAFVDRFLGLPSLRGLGLEVAMVDNDRSAQKAEQLLQRCFSAKGFLGHRHNGLAIARGLRVEGPELILGSSGGSIPCGDKSKTYKELVGLKKRLLKNGLFRYDDMYAFAEKYVADHQWVAPSLRHRFPWVFVDEMQDTDQVQDSLLQKLFGAGCILQRFGDSNQAIFRGIEVEAQTSFPNDGYLGLPESKRFGQTIADYAAPLTQAVSPQKLIGNPDTISKQHTVFLFDANSMSQVLPAFGELIAAEYSDGLPAGFIAKAVGFRKKSPDNPKVENIPNTIGDYLQDFDPKQTLTSERPERMIGFIHKARYLRRNSGECREATDLIFEGILELLHIIHAMDASGLRFTRARLQDALVGAANGLHLRFKESLASLVLGSGSISEQDWQCVIDKLRDILSPWLPSTLPESADEFLAWEPVGESAATVAGEQHLMWPNIYRHDSPIGPVEIELSTIHAAKGQTHTATLVLETYFNRSHDLKAVLPFLAGRETNITDVLRGRMKRVFVAITRPRELLCLAMRKNHLPEADIKVLAERGWYLNDLTTEDGN